MNNDMPDIGHLKNQFTPIQRVEIEGPIRRGKNGWTEHSKTIAELTRCGFLVTQAGRKRNKRGPTVLSNRTFRIVAERPYSPQPHYS
jgi:hypothetical protein